MKFTVGERVTINDPTYGHFIHEIFENGMSGDVLEITPCECGCCEDEYWVIWETGFECTVFSGQLSLA